MFYMNNYYWHQLLLLLLTYANKIFLLFVGSIIFFQLAAACIFPPFLCFCSKCFYVSSASCVQPDDLEWVCGSLDIKSNILLLIVIVPLSHSNFLLCLSFPRKKITFHMSACAQDHHLLFNYLCICGNLSRAAVYILRCTTSDLCLRSNWPVQSILPVTLIFIQSLLHLCKCNFSKIPSVLVMFMLCSDSSYLIHCCMFFIFSTHFTVFSCVTKWPSTAGIWFDIVWV